MTGTARVSNIIVFTLFLAAAAFAGAGSAEHDNSSIDADYSASYVIEIPTGDHRIALVRASLVPADADLYMFPGANQLPGRWSTFVSDLQVFDENDRPVPIVTREDGSWQLARLPVGRISLSYRVNLDHEKHSWSGGVDGAAYWREWGVFYTARSLFVVNGLERDRIAVTFRLPDRWRVTTPWQKQHDDETSFVVPGHEVLATSMFFAGTHKEISVRQGPFEFLLALGGDSVLAQQDVLVGLAEGVLDYYVELMGDVPRLQTRGTAGKPVVIINEAEVTDGEAIGDNISILLEPSAGPMSQQIVRLLFAHEFFHLWNGKSFAPSGEDAEWFKEGFSNYYTLKALHHVGYLNDESFLQLLAGFFYQRYDGDDAVGKEALTRGDLKHEHWGLIYSGGMLVAIAQDLQIRTATNNEASLDDAMRYLFNEYGDKSYELEDIERVLGELNGASQQGFFDRHIRGTERIDISHYLALADIDTEKQDGRTVFRLPKDPDPDKSAVRHGLFGDESRHP